MKVPSPAPLLPHPAGSARRAFPGWDGSLNVHMDIVGWDRMGQDGIGRDEMGWDWMGQTAHMPQFPHMQMT